MKYQLLLLVSALMGAFLLVAPEVDADFLAVFLNSLTVTIGLAVVLSYGRSAIVGAARHPTDRATQLILGITLIFLSLIMNRLGSMVVPHWSASLAFSATAFLVFLAGVLHLAPQYSPQGRVNLQLATVVVSVLGGAWALSHFVVRINPRLF